MFNQLFNMMKPQIEEGVSFISTHEAEELMKNGEAKLVLDVRNPEEYSKRHISGSLLAPLGNLNQYMSEIEKHKNDTVVVICNTQNRSTVAANVLARAGFSDVRVMTGGIAMWANGGHPITH